MNCHSQIWNQAPILEPVRESFRTGQPLEWVKVHDLPDFVYFNHSAHVNKGVGCTTCHGRVDQMPLRLAGAVAADGVVPRVPPRAGEVRAPAERGLQHRLETPANQLELGRQLVEEYDVNPQVTCSTCHR